jgi:WD40 repeat protein
MRIRKRRLAAVVCLALIVCAFGGVWLFAPRPVLFRGHTRPVWSVVASADGRTLASVGGDKTIKLWDVASRKERATLRPPAGSEGAWTVVFSADGKTLASARSEDKEIRLWDVAGGRELAHLVGHQGGVECLAFSPDGGTLASGGNDRTLRLWDVAGHTGRTLREETWSVGSVAFCCGGKTLASAGDGNGAIELWDVAGGKFHRASLLGHQAEVNCLAASPDGETLASADLGGDVKLWDAIAGGERFLEDPRPGHRSVGHLAFSPDGRTLAAIYEYYEMEFWDVASGKNTASLEGFVPPGPPAPPSALSGVRAKLGKVYDGLTKDTALTSSLLFTPGGKVFALGCDHHDDPSVVKMWEIHPVRRKK